MFLFALPATQIRDVPYKIIFRLIYIIIPASIMQQFFKN